LTFCVSADAAADLASLLAFGSCITFDAAEATFLLVVSFALRDCVKADAATAFSALLAVLLFMTVDAAEETFLLVLSDLAMTSLPWFRGPQIRNPTRPNNCRFGYEG
jgi:hypothetical protein